MPTVSMVSYDGIYSVSMNFQIVDLFKFCLQISNEAFDFYFLAHLVVYMYLM